MFPGTQGFENDGSFSKLLNTNGGTEHALPIKILFPKLPRHYSGNITPFPQETLQDTLV